MGMRHDLFRPDPLAEIRQPRADRPALGLVDEEDAALRRTLPLWLRVLTALFALVFTFTAAFSTAADGGAWSPIVPEPSPRVAVPGR